MTVQVMFLVESESVDEEKYVCKEKFTKLGQNRLIYSGLKPSRQAKIQERVNPLVAGCTNIESEQIEARSLRSASAYA